MNMLSVTLGLAMGFLQGPPGLENDFETALGTAGLSTKTARFDGNLLGLFRQGEFTTSLYDAAFENPWRMPFFVTTIRRELSTFGGRPNESQMVLARWSGFGTRRTLLGNPIGAAETRAKSAGSLQSTLDKMKAQGLIKGAIPSLANVPSDVQQAAAMVLDVALTTVEQRRVAFRKFPNLDALYSLFSGPVSAEPGGENYMKMLDVMRQVDIKNLGAGSHDLLLASQTARTMLATADPNAAYDFQLETSWGWIRLCSGKDNSHPDRPTLLTLDISGNDTYLNAPANRNSTNWLSVTIDLAGNDKYLSDPVLAATPIAKFDSRKTATSKPGPGGGMLGTAVLIDVKGDDIYRSHRPGLGSGQFGFGYLLDSEGADIYDAYANSEGYGRFGGGILEDQAGNDQYLGFSKVQGCGETAGFGYLVDRAGDDVYNANDEVLDFPSPQSAQHNVSMAQGAGNGRRGDYVDGYSLAGGVGLLFDMDGKDLYTCGIFGQGVGYWEGVGMLWDGGTENDTYSGQWYVMGAAAHFAIGLLEDEGGNDKYVAPMNMALGAGHDFSIGMLLERGGDDLFTGPNLSLGAGNANGLGVFVDFAGKDNYNSSGITLGKGAEAPKDSLRSRGLCLGVFMDLGGSDVYPGALTYGINGNRVANWTDKGMSPPESQVGVFWDR